MTQTETIYQQQQTGLQEIVPMGKEEPGYKLAEIALKAVNKHFHLIVEGISLQKELGILVASIRTDRGKELPLLVVAETDRIAREVEAGRSVSAIGIGEKNVFLDRWEKVDDNEQVIGTSGRNVTKVFVQAHPSIVMTPYGDMVPDISQDDDQILFLSVQEIPTTQLQYRYVLAIGVDGKTIPSDPTMELRYQTLAIVALEPGLIGNMEGKADYIKYSGMYIVEKAK